MSNKPKNCSKVKNACKYCLEQVTNKNGLQCQGACKKWAHYKCLNYTPGKISDIKAGIIKVMCPCPDCETSQVKEYLTNPPFACSNQTCPANTKGPIKCASTDCPSNKTKKSDRNTSPCSNNTCSQDAAESQTQMSPAKKPRSGSPGPRSCISPVSRAKKPKKVAKVIPSRSSDSCQNSKCKHSSSSICGEERDPKNQASMVNALQEMCGTVGKLSIQIKELMGKIDKLA